jgi:hypothetical protein
LSAVAMYKLRKLHEKLAPQYEAVRQEPVAPVHPDEIDQIEEHLKQIPDADDSEPMLPGIVAEETVG